MFSAARSEFKHLEHFYFHNFIYENVWKDNRRRNAVVTSTAQILRTYGHDYRVIFVGDATMSPYEIMQPGGSLEHWNKEAGAVWMRRVCRTFPRLVWLNPEDEKTWSRSPSLQLARDLVSQRMFPLTLHGLEAAMAALRRPLTRPLAPDLAGESSEPGIVIEPAPQEPPRW
jgi:uncharacterized protein with von Willebrand factor type A (vWA) domain